MKIRYITAHGMADLIEFDDSDRDTLSLVFEPHHVGAVIVGDKILPLKDGVAEISLSSLRDGEYSPRLESESGVYASEGFKKQGKSISVHRADENLIRRLVKRCYELEINMTKLVSRTEDLEKACYGHKIFDFERK